MRYKGNFLVVQYWSYKKGEKGEKGKGREKRGGRKG
jgi:hypothetical protein